MIAIALCVGHDHFQVSAIALVSWGSLKACCLFVLQPLGDQFCVDNKVLYGSS